MAAIYLAMMMLYAPCHDRMTVNSSREFRAKLTVHALHCLISACAAGPYRWKACAAWRQRDVRALTAAECSLKIRRTSSARRSPSYVPPQSASCSENFVVPLDVPGRTLRSGSVRAVSQCIEKTASSDFLPAGLPLAPHRDASWAHARCTNL
jgi:hypothetical protein